MNQIKTWSVLGQRIFASAYVITVLLSADFAHANGFLRTQGKEIVNERGEQVLLRGVGLGNWLLPEGYMWKFGQNGDRPRRIESLVHDLIGPEQARQFWTKFRANYITEADIQRISELGFNSVRPALNSRLFLTGENQWADVEECFMLLDQLIAWCKKHDIYVILDMHGAPGGQTGANIDDSANDQPDLFTDEKNQDRLVELWTTIAKRYKDEPTVAAYDLLNEPLPARTGAAAKYKHLVEPLYRRITEAIRKVDKNHMITLEGVDWANDWSIFTSRIDDNVFYQFHYYCWDNPVVVHDISRYLAHRDRLNAPVWVGETGEKNNAVYWATTEYFEAHGIGWSFWPWKKMETTNTPYSIAAPNDWDAIRAYSRGGPKPTRDVAQRALEQLIENIRLENCVYFPDVVNSILRRAPVTIEAENFGREGWNVSYFVKNSKQMSKYYRPTESVSISVIAENRDTKSSEFAIQLREGEWVEYCVSGQEAGGHYAATLKLLADEAPATLNVSVNGYKEELTEEGNGWHEIGLKAIPLKQGVNRIRLSVTQGALSLDWLRLEAD